MAGKLEDAEILRKLSLRNDLPDVNLRLYAVDTAAPVTLQHASGWRKSLTSDAHLAALAIEHGAELCSSDTDFGRFKGLRWTDPLS